MSDKRENGRFPFGATVAVGLMMLLVLYPLSVGPMVWLVNGREVPEPVMWALTFIYAPLEWSTERSEAVRNLFAWYLAFWS